MGVIFAKQASGKDVTRRDQRELATVTPDLPHMWYWTGMQIQQKVLRDKEILNQEIMLDAVSSTIITTSTTSMTQGMTLVITETQHAAP